MADYAGHKFTRCPATYVGARELVIVERARSGYLMGLGVVDRLRLPAKFHAALEHGQFLLELEKAQQQT